MNLRDFEIKKESQNITYVLFRDNWCSVCKDVEYVIKEIRNMNVPTYEIDVAKNLDLMDKYSIEKIPTVIVFRKGRIVAHLEGLYPKVKYLSFL